MPVGRGGRRRSSTTGRRSFSAAYSQPNVFSKLPGGVKKRSVTNKADELSLAAASLTDVAEEPHATMADMMTDEAVHRALGAVSAFAGKNDSNRFYDLCDEIVTCTQSFESRLVALNAWKDEVLAHSLPSSMMLKLTMVCAQLFRAKSELYSPLYSLCDDVRIMAAPWQRKENEIKEVTARLRATNHELVQSYAALSKSKSALAEAKDTIMLQRWARLTLRLLAAAHKRDFARLLRDLQRTKSVAVTSIIMPYLSHKDVLALRRSASGSTVNSPRSRKGSVSARRGRRNSTTKGTRRSSRLPPVKNFNNPFAVDLGLDVNGDAAGDGAGAEGGAGGEGGEAAAAAAANAALVQALDFDILLSLQRKVQNLASAFMAGAASGSAPDMMASLTVLADVEAGVNTMMAAALNSPHSPRRVRPESHANSPGWQKPSAPFPSDSSKDARTEKFVDSLARATQHLAHATNKLAAVSDDFRSMPVAKITTEGGRIVINGLEVSNASPSLTSWLADYVSGSESGGGATGPALPAGVAEHALGVQTGSPAGGGSLIRQNLSSLRRSGALESPQSSVQSAHGVGVGAGGYAGARPPVAPGTGTSGGGAGGPSPLEQLAAGLAAGLTPAEAADAVYAAGLKGEAFDGRAAAAAAEAATASKTKSRSRSRSRTRTHTHSRTRSKSGGSGSGASERSAASGASARSAKSAGSVRSTGGSPAASRQSAKSSRSARSDVGGAEGAASSGGGGGGGDGGAASSFTAEQLEEAAREWQRRMSGTELGIDPGDGGGSRTDAVAAYAARRAAVLGGRPKSAPDTALDYRIMEYTEALDLDQIRALAEASSRDGRRGSADRGGIASDREPRWHGHDAVPTGGSSHYDIFSYMVNNKSTTSLPGGGGAESGGLSNSGVWSASDALLGGRGGEFSGGSDDASAAQSADGSGGQRRGGRRGRRRSRAPSEASTNMHSLNMLTRLNDVIFNQSLPRLTSDGSPGSALSALVEGAVSDGGQGQHSRTRTRSASDGEADVADGSRRSSRHSAEGGRLRPGDVGWTLEAALQESGVVGLVAGGVRGDSIGLGDGDGGDGGRRPSRPASALGVQTGSTGSTSPPPGSARSEPGGGSSGDEYATAVDDGEDWAGRDGAVLSDRAFSGSGSGSGDDGLTKKEVGGRRGSKAGTRATTDWGSAVAVDDGAGDGRTTAGGGGVDGEGSLVLPPRPPSGPAAVEGSSGRSGGPARGHRRTVSESGPAVLTAFGGPGRTALYHKRANSPSSPRRGVARSPPLTVVAASQGGSRAVSRASGSKLSASDEESSLSEREVAALRVAMAQQKGGSAASLLSELASEYSGGLTSRDNTARGGGEYAGEYVGGEYGDDDDGYGGEYGYVGTDGRPASAPVRPTPPAGASTRGRRPPMAGRGRGGRGRGRRQLGVRGAPRVRDGGDGGAGVGFGAPSAEVRAEEDVWGSELGAAVDMASILSPPFEYDPIREIEGLVQEVARSSGSFGETGLMLPLSLVIELAARHAQQIQDVCSYYRGRVYALLRARLLRSPKWEPPSARIRLPWEAMDFMERTAAFEARKEERRRVKRSAILGKELTDNEARIESYRRTDASAAAPTLPNIYLREDNEYEPRARQYWHPTGSGDARLTQPPSIFSLGAHEERRWRV